MVLFDREPLCPPAGYTQSPKDVYTRSRKFPSEVLPDRWTKADIALPPGRKSDPQAPAFNMESFLDSVFGPGGLAGLQTTDMVVITNQLNIREGAGTDFAIVAQVNEGDVVQVDKIVVGETINGHRGWAHLADNRGFATVRFLRIRR